MPLLPQTIEEAIGQIKPFRNEQHKAMVNVIFTYHRLVEQIRTVLEPFGLTIQQYNALRILRGAGEPISTSEIRARMLDGMPDTSRLVDRLHRKGWVVRTPCPNDRRLVDVSLTEAGLQILQRTDEDAAELDRLAASLSDDEALTLSTLLDRMRVSWQEDEDAERSGRRSNNKVAAG